MNLKNKILYKLSRKSLEKNNRFKDTHLGESCYIFGNGASIKYFDLSNFNDRVSFCCSSMFLHNDFEELDAKYYYMGHPFVFYKYWKNQYEKKYQKNLLGELYKKNIKLNPQMEYFVSLSNYFVLYGQNINYIHHFDNVSEDLTNIDLSYIFSPMTGALAGMIGQAIYMGFKDIILVGCDYTFKPKAYGHFYEYGKREDSSVETFSKKLLESAMSFSKIRTLTESDNYKGDIVESISYESLTSKKPSYQENYEIISDENLLKLSKLGMQYYIYDK